MCELITLKSNIIQTGQELYRLGLITATDGNISARLDDDHILITASGARKGCLMPDDVILCDMRGHSESSKPVSSEMRLHLAVYRRRSDVRAVIHAHPPMAVACSLAGIRLDEPLLPAVWMTVGPIPTARFAPPASPLGANAVEDLIVNHNALILDRHGTVTVGSSLEEALGALERVEFLAGAVLRAHSAGNIRNLSTEELEQVETAERNY